MKLHVSVIEKLLQIYQHHGGYETNDRLIAALSALDLSPYERKTTNQQEFILVNTEDLMKKMNRIAD